MSVPDLLRRYPILLTQRCRAGSSNSALRAVPYQLRRRSSNMRDTDVFPSHHQIRDIGRVQAPKWDSLGFVVSLIPTPVLQSEVILLVARVVHAECSFVEDYCIWDLGMVAGIVVGEDEIAFVP